MSGTGPTGHDAMRLAIAMLTRRSDGEIPDDDPVLLAMMGLGAEDGALAAPMAAAGLLEVGLILLDRVCATEYRTRGEVLGELGLRIADI